MDALSVTQAAMLDSRPARVPLGERFPALQAPEPAAPARGAPEAPRRGANAARAAEGFVTEAAVSPDTNAALSPLARAAAALAARLPLLALPLAGPWLGRAPVTAQQLAGALGERIGRSGLFYESHLADWLEGRRDAASMHEEAREQARLVASLATALDSDAIASEEAGVSPSAARELALAAWQLFVLEHGALAAALEPWKGARALWEIAAEDRGRRDGPPTAWRTRLVLETPALGTVRVEMWLHADRLAISFLAAANTRRLFQSEAAALAAALTAAGFESVSIRYSDEH